MVYKMLIAEDEQEEYELVLFLLKKLKLDSCLSVCHAENGRQALNILEEASIDLLFTDIEMPFASGLELAAKARAKNPMLPIIFFSCYDNFSYIKTALSVQADNYLLKPLDPEEFERTMLRAFEFLHQSEVQRKRRESRSQALRNHSLYLKLNRMPCEQSPDAEERARFSTHYTQLLLLHFEESFFDCEPNRSEAFIDFLQALLPYAFDFVNLNSSQSVLLIQAKAEASMDAFPLLCQKIHEEIFKAYQMNCFIAIRSLSSGNADLADAYEDACNLLETRFFYQDRYVFQNHPLKMSFPENYDLCSRILNDAKADMDAGNMARLTTDIMKLNQFFEQSSHYSHIYVRYIYSSLLYILYDHTETDEMPGDIERIFSCSFIHEIEQIVFAALARLQAKQNGISTSRKHAILLAKQYIHKHYRETLSLDELAGAVYLNSCYLSTIFKMATGSSINKYIKAVRMEKAKELLSKTNQKVSDVGAAVGFSNTSYFIRSFHEYYGKTPDKMRQT